MAADESSLTSIAMPVLNCEKTIYQAVRSIQLQSYRNWELLVIDDGSTDRTLEICRRFTDSRIKVFADCRRKFLAKRLNQAIKLSSGEYFARMDGDDVAYPERFENQHKYLKAHPEVDLLGGYIVLFRGEGEIFGIRSLGSAHADICRRPWSSFYLAHVTWMGKTEFFRKHYYRADMTNTQDQEFLLRTYRSSRFAALPEVLVGVREDSISLRKTAFARLQYMSALFRESKQSGDWNLALRGIPFTASKLLLECFVIGTSLEQRILRHRFSAAPQEIVHRWHEVWSSVQPQSGIPGS